MSENELVATPTETQNPVEEPATPEVAEPAATDGAEKPAEPSKTPEQLELERLRRALTKRDRTQGKMHGELEDLRRQLAERQAQQPAEPVQETKPADLRTVVEREALTLAERIAEQRAFTEKCNTVADTGKKEFKDFPDALSALIEEAGPLVTDKGVPTPLGEQILEADEPAALIHYLGKNPELAAELDGLSPGRLARKLAVIEQQMTAKPKTSSAPKPLTPVRGASSSNDLSDDVPLEEWNRRFRKSMQRR